MRFFLLVILIFVVQSSNAQTRLGEHINHLTVVSTTGLNMRSAPNLQSKVLASVPYGAKVEILSSESFGLDTVGFHTYHSEFRGKKESYKNDVSGYWLKVKHGNISGYMLDAYLGRIEPLREEHKGLNQDYIYLQPRGDCYDNFYYNLSMHWYGFYESENGIDVRPVEVSFFYGQWEELYRPCMISANDNEDLVFMLGSKQPIKMKTTQNILYSKYQLQTIPDRDSRQKLLFEILSKQGIYQELVVEDGLSYNRYFMERDGIKQQLDEKFTYHEGDFNVSWIGDIDGDGKNDYIFNYGDKMGYSVLYLSSAAEAGQIVKPVTVFYYGYCC